jgi:hypothetical protein
MCKDYKAEACQNSECFYAHKGDGYSYLMPYHKLCQVENDNIEPAALRDEASDHDSDHDSLLGDT